MADRKNVAESRMRYPGMWAIGGTIVFTLGYVLWGGQLAVGLLIGAALGCGEWVYLRSRWGRSRLLHWSRRSVDSS